MHVKKGLVKIMLAKTYQKKLGFSFIEFLVVVVIIGVLTAIAIPAYGIYVSRSKASQMLRDVKDLKIAIGNYRTINGKFTNASNSHIKNVYGVDDPAQISDAIDKVDVKSNSSNTVIVNVLATSTSLRLKEGQFLELILTGNWSEKGLEWECSSQGQTKYAPFSCKVKNKKDKPRTIK